MSEVDTTVRLRRDLAEMKRQRDEARSELQNCYALNERMKTVLKATQKALRDMQAQRDKAREGKR